jgi:hypothetical protein
MVNLRAFIVAVMSAYGGSAIAMCLPEFACYEISGSTVSCKVTQVDGSSFVEVEVLEPEVAMSTCGIAQDEFSAESTQRTLRWLEKETRFYAPNPNGVSCSDLGENFRAAYAPICCDTGPHDECALQGVRVQLRTPKV